LTSSEADAFRVRPFDAINTDKLLHQITRLFAYQKRRLLHNLHNRWAETAKAAPKTPKPQRPKRPQVWSVDDDVDDALDEPMTEHLVAEFERPLADAGMAASTNTINRIAAFVTPSGGGPPFLPPIVGGPGAEPIRGPWDPAAITLRTHTKAVDYAASRAAELVGRKYDVAGNLIENPDAQWAINATTRDIVQSEVRDAVALHWDVDKLADRLEDTGVFSPDRAEMIARTEISFAQNAGVLEAARQARDATGVKLQKVWTLGGDNPCPICEDAADEGAIDLEDEFGPGDAPPAHPNCECELELIEAENGDEDEEE
jgi:hypothetical protein